MACRLSRRRTRRIWLNRPHTGEAGSARRALVTGGTSGSAPRSRAVSPPRARSSRTGRSAARGAEVAAEHASRYGQAIRRNQCSVAAAVETLGGLDIAVATRAFRTTDRSRRRRTTPGTRSSIRTCSAHAYACAVMLHTSRGAPTRRIVVMASDAGVSGSRSRSPPTRSRSAGRSCSRRCSRSRAARRGVRCSSCPGDTERTSPTTIGRLCDLPDTSGWGWWPLLDASSTMDVLAAVAFLVSDDANVTGAATHRRRHARRARTRRGGHDVPGPRGAPRPSSPAATRASPAASSASPPRACASPSPAATPCAARRSPHCSGATFVRCDYLDRASADAGLAEATAALDGRIDLLVANAWHADVGRHHLDAGPGGARAPRGEPDGRLPHQPVTSTAALTPGALDRCDGVRHGIRGIHEISW